MIFGIGASIFLAGGWLADWWIVRLYKFSTIEQINQTVWALSGSLHVIWQLAHIVGPCLVAIGMSLYADARRTWMAAMASAFIILSAMFHETTDYSEIGFGLIGLSIALLFIAIVWYWGKNSLTLMGPAKTAAVFQLIGCIFFFTASISVCGILGSPSHTNPVLYFTGKVIAANPLSKSYALGMKIGIYLVFGFFFNFLSFYKAEKSRN